MKERLKELLLSSDPIKERDLDDDLGDGELDEIVDHLLTNGVIVTPVKAGDKVYCDGKFFADHCAGEIMEFLIAFTQANACSTHRGEIDMIFEYDRFGKDFFTSREEAEAALKERSGKEQRKES